MVNVIDLSLLLLKDGIVTLNGLNLPLLEGAYCE